VSAFESLAVLMELLQERGRQDEKWGEQNWATGFSGAFLPRANRARDETEQAAQDGTLTWRHILTEEYYEALAETEPARQREELVQVGAVVVAMIECLDRKERLAIETSHAAPVLSLIRDGNADPETENRRRDRAREAQSALRQETSPEDQAQDVA
jgi:hypothetical protein